MLSLRNTTFHLLLHSLYQCFPSKCTLVRKIWQYIDYRSEIWMLHHKIESFNKREIHIIVQWTYHGNFIWISSESWDKRWWRFSKDLKAICSKKFHNTDTNFRRIVFARQLDQLCNKMPFYVLKIWKLGVPIFS